MSSAPSGQSDALGNSHSHDHAQDHSHEAGVHVATGFDVLDIFVFCSIVFALLLYFFRKKNPSSLSSSSSGSSLSASSSSSALNGGASGKGAGSSSTSSKSSGKVDKSLLGRMKRMEASIVVFYGSQTGTAEDYANRLAQEAQVYGFKAISMDLEDLDVSDLEKLNDIPNSVAMFCMATYGEGDPTDNAITFYEWLKDEEPSLSGIRFVVFGLGNKTYEHFNFMGRFTDQKLEECGGQRIFDRGEGDDDGNLEEDFLSWKAKMWPAVCKTFNKPIPENVNVAPMRQYKIKELDVFDKDKVFTGEMQKLKAYESQKPPFDSKNPFLSAVHIHRELHKGGDRSCMHIELDITGSGMRYEAGDHVGVFATNDPSVVASIADLVGINLDTVFTLEAVDGRSSKKSPFPCPCTYRTALSHYVDIVSQPRAHLLRELAEFASDPAEKDFLIKLTTEEGKKDFQDWIQNAQRTIADVLQDLPSVKPPIDLLLEFLPRLQCRYYSISSSPKAHPNHVHITAVLVEYKTTLGRVRKGVATSWLALQRKEGEALAKVPIFIRKSSFKLPKQISAPIVMVGPGTGLAPFRGFLQDRKAERTKLTSSNASVNYGETVLYFGCRSKHHDYIYEAELHDMLKDSTLTELHVAFSRDQSDKEYVTHKLSAHKKRLWELIGKGAHIYVCGDARNMARNVHQIILETVMENKSCTQAEAAQFIKKLQSEGRYSQDVWT